LLAPIVALFLFVSGRTRLLLHVASATGLVGSLLVAAFYEGEARDLAVVSVAFFALAICIGALVQTRTPPSPSAEAMPAANRSTTPDEAPPYPAIGPTLPEKAAPRHSPFVAISAQDDRVSAALLVAASFWGGTRFRVRYWRRQPDGSDRWVESGAEPLREPTGTRLWSRVSADIDDQRPELEPPTKIASNPPSDDEAVWAAKIIENLLGNAWAFDAAGRPTYLTPLAQTLVAVTLEEFQAAVDEGHTFFKRTAHPDDYDRISAAWRHSLQTGDPFFLDRRIRRGSGIHEWNRTGFVPTRDRQGRITGWYGATIDLDAHRIAERELRESERQLQQLIDTVPVQIWCVTPSGEPSYINKTMMKFIGLKLEDFAVEGLSKAVETIVHPDDRAALLSALTHSFSTGVAFAMKFRTRRWDGEYRWQDGRAEPLLDDGGRIIQWYGVNVDIEDETRMQSTLRAAQDKLARAAQAASLAELSASIAHEVNQPLAAVVANSHACQRWLTVEPPNIERAQKTVERIIRDANAAADVVSRIRALFRHSIDARVFAALEGVIAEARNLMAEEASRHHVQMDVEIESDLPRVALDRVQIQQVLINLMRNGMEAMDTVADDRVLAVRARRMTDMIQTEITDRGPGIAFPDRMFEPFYTTKEQGMGMGLAICRSIIESHGGRLWADKNEPRGAAFIFTLPIEMKSAS
jgi:PAS domain S-box-containing protein